MASGTFRALVFMGVTGGNGEAILQISPQPVQTVMKGSQGLKAIWLLRGKGNGVRGGGEDNSHGPSEGEPTRPGK